MLAALWWRARFHHKGAQFDLWIVFMLRVPVHNIRPGMVLARPVMMPSDVRRVLLQRDREIPAEMVPRLKQLGVLEVWIRHRSFEFLEDLVDEGLGDRQRDIYLHVRRNFESMVHEPATSLNVADFQQSIGELFDFLKKSNASSVLLQKLDAFDNYLLSHSTNVCYLALLLGLQLERYLIDQRRSKSPRDAKDLRELGLGCLLHDVGKINTPREILFKPGRLTSEEMDVMKRHPEDGFKLVRGRVPSASAQVVLNHHQRYAGEGYPERKNAATGEPLPPICGQQIPIFSRMASICDVYDAATTKRCYSDAKPPVQALHEMRSWCQGFFDPVVEEAFYRVIPAFPIGQVVALSNGIEAVVVDFNADFPTRPKVQGLKDPNGEPYRDPSLEEIDLAMHYDLDIVEIDGLDVRPFIESLESSGQLSPVG